MNKILFYSIFICFWFYLSQAKRNYIVNQTDVFCHSNLSEVENVGCRIELVGIKGALFGFISLRKPVKKFTVQAILDVFSPNGRSYRVLDLEQDGCSIFQTLQKNKLINLFIQRVLEHMNELPSCPVKANFNHTLQNMIFDEDLLPVHLPVCKLRIYVRLITNKESSESATLIGHGEIISTKTETKEKRKG